MTKEELMIGDWVQSEQLVAPARYSGFFRHYPKPVSGNPYTRLELLYESGREGGEVPEDKVMPIPLSPEILEKNGFKDVSRDTVICGAFLRRKDGIIWVMFDTHKVRITNQTSDFQDYIQVPCTFVHELQHALRLCGLNNLADNFKI